MEMFSSGSNDIAMLYIHDFGVSSRDLEPDEDFR